MVGLFAGGKCTRLSDVSSAALHCIIMIHNYCGKIGDLYHFLMTISTKYVYYMSQNILI